MSGVCIYRNIALTLVTGSSSIASIHTHTINAIRPESVGLPDRSYHPAIGPFECRGQIGDPIGPRLSSFRRAFKY